MGAPTAAARPRSSASPTAERFKREGFRRTKHDSAFSSWKILIGPFDWDDHAMGKEGAEKYRTQNLPTWNPSPGVYELGIAVTRQTFGSNTRELDSSSVVPVYLGQADNLRIRLQQYGRDGAHLEKGVHDSAYRGPGLFTDVFSKGFPIVYRCAPMKSKSDAEITEKQLLDTFDYAWNKGSNGIRRHDDICRELDRRAKASQFSLMVKKFLSFNQKRVGIKIKASDPVNNDDAIASSRVFGIKRVTIPPQEVQYGLDYCDPNRVICGVAIGNGSICTSSPVKGRKRCAAHKGMRVKGCVLGSDRGGEAPPIIDSGIDSGASSGDVCGVAVGNGYVCNAAPVKGRKRCTMHKGMRATIPTRDDNGSVLGPFL